MATWYQKLKKRIVSKLLAPHTFRKVIFHHFSVVGPYIALNFALALCHISSTLFVNIPVKGATKFKVWLTVPWANPSCGRLRYAAHIPLHNIVFGCTHCWMISSNLAWSLAGTGTRNPFLVSALLSHKEVTLVLSSHKQAFVNLNNVSISP